MAAASAALARAAAGDWQAEVQRELEVLAPEALPLTAAELAARQEGVEEAQRHHQTRHVPRLR